MKKIIFAFLILSFAACKTAQIDFSREYSAEQLIQLGQERYNAKDYKNSILCYEEVIKRYGEQPEHYIEARYEIGRIALKQKDYAKAYEYFDEILEIYSSTNLFYLPAAYKKLAQISIDQIPEGSVPAKR